MASTETRIGTSLVTAFDYVWDRFTSRLEGLDDDEYFWFPTPDSWTLRQDADGQWRLDGEGGGGSVDNPEPAPVTTIAWRIGHVGGLALRGFTDRLFGDATFDRTALGLAGTAAGALDYLQKSYRGWRAGMVTLDDERWWAALGPSWGPYAEANTVDLALHVFDELVHHAGEISLLRDLYRESHPGPTG